MLLVDLSSFALPNSFPSFQKKKQLIFTLWKLYMFQEELSHCFHPYFSVLYPCVSEDLWESVQRWVRPALWPEFLGILIFHTSLHRAITSLLDVQLFSPYPIYHCSSSCSSAWDKISGKFLLSSQMILAFWNLVHLGLSVSLARWKV